MGEKIQIDYNHQIDYSITPQNQVGTDADFLSLYPNDTPARVIPVPTGDIAYVRKFGVAVTGTACTHLEDPVDVNCTVKCYALDGTLLGSRVGGGVFTAGSTVAVAQQCYLSFVAAGGAVTLNTFGPVYSATIGGTGYTFIVAADVIADGSSLTIYLSTTNSTYYDAGLIYGGARHTPVLNGADTPYFTIASAYAALAAANNDAVCILDSATYDEDLTTGNQALDSSDTIVYAAANQSPTITRGVGARVTREVSTQYNNLSAIYFNENGLDTNAGTWQAPKLTVAGAIAGIGALTNIVYGGFGATINSGIFNEAVTIAAAYTLESDYGYLPKVYQIGGNAITITHISSIIRGMTVYDSQYGIHINVTDFIGSIIECSCYNNSSGIYSGSATTSGTINGCNCYNNTNGINISNTAETTDVNVINNICYNNTSSGILVQNTSATLQLSIDNNVCYDNYYGIKVYAHDYPIGSPIGTYAVENCTCFNNAYGFVGDWGESSLIIFRNCIGWGNTIYDYAALTSSCSIDYSIWETQLNTALIGGQNLNSDPKYCSEISSYKLGISADSPGYRSDDNTNDRGANLIVIEIDADSVVINGIKIDGQEQYNNAVFIRDTADHTGLNILWCSIYDCQGIAIDLYDDGTDLDAVISNNLIHGNGNGIKLCYGGNTIEQNCIYNNSVFGIHSNYKSNTFNHNVFYLNQYGIYLNTNSGGISIKNSIFNQNSLYGIYSEIPILITYCCITDAVNSNVDITDTSNITDNPLFIDTTSESEDFRLKRVERNFIVESPCLDASDDSTFPDIGAYDELVTVNNDSWKKYVLAHNPRNMNEGALLKGVISYDDVFGNIHNYMENTKIELPMQWDNNSMTSDIQRLKIKYFQTLIPSRKNNKTEDECEFRIKLLPNTFYGTGTGTVDATEKTLTSSGWTEDEKKGWYVTIKFTSDSATGAVTASTKKLAVSPSPTWATDEWAGYYFPYNGYYYYVLSNDADELTLSDPNDTLIDGSAIDWSIVKYFKVDSNTTTLLTLIDDSNELANGSYDYYFDFILCRVSPKNFTYSQTVYSYDEAHNNFKSGYGITFEEID